MNKRTSLLICLVCCLLLGCLPLHTQAATAPEITWAYLEEAENYAVLHFETPSQYLGMVDSYELSTDGVEFVRIADGAGGKMQMPDGGRIYLRCTYQSSISNVWIGYVQFGETFILTDTISGASIVYRASCNYPNNAYLSADRITSGSVFEDVKQAVQTSKHFELYDIYFLYANGLTFDPADASLIRIPLGDKFKRNNCNVYFVDEAGKRFLSLEVSYDRTDIVFRSKGSGLYFVTDEWDQQTPVETPPTPAMGSTFDFYGNRLIMGDIDGDKTVSANDARIALRASVGLDAITLLQTESTDTDWSGDITAADARTILRHSVGL